MKPDTERLRKLADHLLNGKLGNDKFAFWTYRKENTRCGTIGCAIGECPFVFPEEWTFIDDIRDKPNRLPVLIGLESYAHSQISGIKFFCLTKDQFDNLFIPGNFRYTKPLSKSSPNDTKEQVANNIIAFCDIQDNLKD